MNMHRVLFLATLSAAFVGHVALARPAQAALIAYDSFSVDGIADNGDYNAAPLQGQGPSVGSGGFTGNWMSASGSTGAQRAFGAALTHPNMPGTPQTGIGTTLHGVIIPASNVGTAHRRVSRKLDFVPPDGTYYASFLQQYAAQTTPYATHYLGFGALQGTDGNYDTWVGNYVGLYDGGLDFYKGTGNALTSQTTNLVESVTIGETYMVVLEIAYSTSGSDSITVRVYDSSSTEMANQAFTGLAVNLDYLVFGSRGHAIDATRTDEFRFGTELSDVFFAAVVPEPNAVMLLAVGLLGLLVCGRRR